MFGNTAVLWGAVSLCVDSGRRLISQIPAVFLVIHTVVRRVQPTVAVMRGGSAALFLAKPGTTGNRLRCADITQNRSGRVPYGDTADVPCGSKNRYERKKHMKKTHTVSKHLLLCALLLFLIMAFCACTVGGLADAQQQKVAELTVYSESDYRAAEWAQLHEIYENAVAEIMSLSDKNEVENYDTAAVNAKMAAIKTDAQLTAEEKAAEAARELDAAKTAKIGELSYSFYRESDYRAAEWSALTAIYENAVAEIRAFTGKADVESYDVAAVNAKMAAVKTNAQLSSEEAALELENAKKEKTAELTVYKQSDYRTAEWGTLSALYENAVAGIRALSDISKVKNYDTATVNAKMAAIKTDAQLTEEEEAARPAPTITTTLKDGTTYKSNRLTIDVFAKNNAGEKIASSVTLNGENVAINWDDIEKTSFTLYLSEGKNIVVISASDGKKQTTQTYTVYFAEDAVTFTFSADCFTIGGGYIIAPMQIRLDTALMAEMAEHYGMTDAAAMKENLCGAYILDYFLWLNGYTISYTGSLESSFYLATILGFDFDGSGESIPANLREAVEAQGGSIDNSDPTDGLGEFCFTFMSGWMYMVNGSLPNVGMSDYYPQEGDVFRLQFTLYGYGSDIGNCAWGGEPMFEDVGQERDLLTAAMAKAAAVEKENTAEYIAAFELIQQFGITADELNEAATALLAVCGA